jgi:hypothetical protein
MTGPEDQCKRAQELADLRWHWGPAYVITAPYGMFRAERRDDGAAISCPTAGALRILIRDDYAARPFRADAPSPAGRGAEPGQDC